MADSKITWTHKVWNPIRGCSPVSSGCKFCYASRFAHRFSAEGQRYEGLTRWAGDRPVWVGEARSLPGMLSRPLEWKTPRKVFVNSMSDLFHPDVSFDFIMAVFGVMAVCRQHTFQILTKRPDRMVEWFAWAEKDLKGRHRIPAMAHHAACLVDEHSRKHADRIYQAINKMGFGYIKTWPLPNVWLGVSVESQKTVDRIEKLLTVPAAVHWVSSEPLVGSIEIPDEYLTGEYAPRDLGGAMAEELGPRLSWVVVGGESGPNARPVDPAWVRAIRDQCQEYDVPFLFKQWGEWGPVTGELTTKHVEGLHYKPGTREVKVVDDQGQNHTYYWLEEGWMEWVGKHAAGRELDGKIWDEYPVR